MLVESKTGHLFLLELQRIVIINVQQVYKHIPISIGRFQQVPTNAVPVHIATSHNCIIASLFHIQHRVIFAEIHLLIVKNSVPVPWAKPRLATILKLRYICVYMYTVAQTTSGTLKTMHGSTAGCGGMTCLACPARRKGEEN